MIGMKGKELKISELKTGQKVYLRVHYASIKQKPSVACICNILNITSSTQNMWVYALDKGIEVQCNLRDDNVQVYEVIQNNTLQRGVDLLKAGRLNEGASFQYALKQKGSSLVEEGLGVILEVNAATKRICIYSIEENKEIRIGMTRENCFLARVKLHPDLAYMLVTRVEARTNKNISNEELKKSKARFTVCAREEKQACTKCHDLYKKIKKEAGTLYQRYPQKEV